MLWHNGGTLSSSSLDLFVFSYLPLHVHNNFSVSFVHHLHTHAFVMMLFFQSELGWSMLDMLGRSADSGRWTPLQKQETKKDQRELTRCHSDA